MFNKDQSLKELRTIPGVGKNVAEDFWNVGVRRVTDLKNADPVEIYGKICSFQGQPIDRCLLYVCRCAVYFASHKTHDPDKLCWWNWKDSKLKP